MNIAIFKTWLIKQGTSLKVASDIISRLKKIDQSLIDSPISSSVDNEFSKDLCSQLLKCFSNSGKNSYMEAFKLYSLPIGKTYLSSYKLSLNRYIEFKKVFPNG